MRPFHSNSDTRHENEDEQDDGDRKQHGRVAFPEIRIACRGKPGGQQSNGQKDQVSRQIDLLKLGGPRRHAGAMDHQQAETDQECGKGDKKMPTQVHASIHVR